MRILVTGRAGQVSRCLVEKARLVNVDVVAIGRPELDLEHPDGIGSSIAALRPDVIVSAAAYTAVDAAESEPDRAFAINAIAPGLIGEVARRLNVPVIHLSTDYVFSGDKNAPYNEEDVPAPQTIYGKSKLAGEDALTAATPNHAILRTAWVYSPFGNNFIKTMLRLAGDRDQIRVVDDQSGNPTAACDLADAVLSAARMMVAEPAASALRGTFHLAGRGDTNWAEFAAAIFEVSRAYDGPTATVVPIRTLDYPTAARRPANSRLQTRKFREAFGVQPRAWRVAMEETLQRLLAENRGEMTS